MAVTYSQTASWKPELISTLNIVGLQNTRPDRFQPGLSDIPTLNRSLANGSGANNAEMVWHQKRSILTTANDDLDLQALTDEFGGAATNFILIKWFLVFLNAPATGVKLVIGNYGANGWTGPYGNTNDTEDVFDQCWKVNQIDGWLVDATHRYLRINNPTGSTVAYHIALWGEV